MSGCKTGYCSLRIFISFVKLIVVINITEQSNVTSQNGSCASNSLTLVFLNFLHFYCLPRSLESLYVSFPVLLNLFRGQLVVIHTAIGLFQKYHNTLCCPSKILHQHCFQFLLGRKAYCLLIHQPVLSSICQVLIKSAFFFLNASNSSVSLIVH